MEALFVFVLVMGGLFWFLVCMAPAIASSAHKKEKARKLAMMKEYPHLAKEIWQSIEEQEARFQANMKSFGDAFK